MGREIYNIINDMAEVLNASQMQKLQEVLINRLSENTMSDYLHAGNEEFLDMFLTAKHLEGCNNCGKLTIDNIRKVTEMFINNREQLLGRLISE